ncbi:DUF924 family protein [Paracoccus cavernae]|uniref:DUF924 family protein n=1 Tax=Paracoccus cavernae TaxID=1571207 RepID=A0ABT8D380_9RHOB|nr:DUF924 family protein [Paracoccus cavernae]
MPHQHIIRFWVDEIGEKGWYERSDDTDEMIRARFLPHWEEAKPLTDDWCHSAEHMLAAVILTDQFPRNMFREDGRAFATDALAREIADKAIAQGFDLATPMPMRQFFYMPFMHSRSLADQDRAVALCGEFLTEDSHRHAILHRETIRVFGRFPWRNAMVGRETTPAEQAFLDLGGYGALVTGRLSLEALREMV